MPNTPLKVDWYAGLLYYPNSDFLYVLKLHNTKWIENTSHFQAEIDSHLSNPFEIDLYFQRLLELRGIGNLNF